MSLVNQVLRDLDKNNQANAALKFEVVEASSKLNSKLLWYGFAIVFCLGIYLLITSVNGKQQREPVQSFPTTLTSLNQLEKSVEKLAPAKLLQDSNQEILNSGDQDSGNQDSLNQDIAVASLAADQSLVAAQSIEEDVVLDSVLPVEQNQQQSKAAPLVALNPKQAAPTPATDTIQQEKLANDEVKVKIESLQSQLNNQLVSIKRNYARGQHELVVTDLTSLLLTAPDFHAARIYLIKICWQQSLCPTLDILNEAVQKFPHYSEYTLMAARFHFESKAFETASGLLKSINSNQSNYQEMLQLRALTLQNLQQHNAALMDYAELLKRSPNRGDLFLAMGISFDALGDQIKAQQSFQRALQDQRLSARQHQFAATKISQYQG